MLPLFYVSIKLAYLRDKFGEQYFLSVFCPLSPMGANQATGAAVQHEQEVTVTHCSPSCHRLGNYMSKIRDQSHFVSTLLTVIFNPSYPDKNTNMPLKLP